MCSNYSRPTSPTPPGRIKSEYTQYNQTFSDQPRPQYQGRYEKQSEQDPGRARPPPLPPSSTDSPHGPQEGHFYGHQQASIGPYFYAQDPFSSREDAAAAAASAARGGMRPAPHTRGKSVDSDVHATRQEQRQETFSVYHHHAIPGARPDQAGWALSPVGPGSSSIPYPPQHPGLHLGAAVATTRGKPMQPRQQFYSQPYMGIPSGAQGPAGQPWPPMGTYGAGVRGSETYYTVQGQPQWAQQGDEHENSPIEPRYGNMPYPIRAPNMLRPTSAGRPPQLVRTSALAQARSSWSLGSYNSYDGATTAQPNAREQASLTIDGDLDTMIKDWHVDEQVNFRRLVLFERIQDGPSIRLKFHAISREDYDPQTTVISCIYWKERDQYYVTSVDCITLLELIINQKFSVEEKNRVRRNLEVCKPLTVSKTKSELTSFFKLIMKFEPPRPRNIEKDVKVFPWSMLGSALKKIVGKYSASYVNNSESI